MVNEGLDKIIEKYEKKWEADLREARNARRWTVGIIITCTIALGGYLSALIHITH